MDTSDLEPRPGLHKNQSRVQALLRGNLRRTFRNVPGHPYEQGSTHGSSPKAPRTAPVASAKTVFVNSMSDLFQDAVPDDYIDAVATVMLHANWHTYQVLTKRATGWKNSSTPTPVRR